MSRTRLPFFPRICRSEAIRNDPNAKRAVVFYSEDLPKQSDLQTTDGNNAVVTFFENLPDMQSALNFV